MATIARDYRFAAEPRAVDARTSNYREYLEEIPPANIMYDRRVVRGNTYASMIIPASTQQEIERQQARDRDRTKHLNQPKPLGSSIKELSASELPDNADNQVTVEEASREAYLEPLAEPVLNPTHTQVEVFVDRPPTPLFIPNEEGQDEETQIEDGDLFDFDTEVDPILEVIVGKSLEHARMEVLEEFEIELMRKHHREFTQRRDAELIEVQRMEAEFLRREQEDIRRKLQARTQRELKKSAHQKYVCRITAKRFLASVRFDASKRLVDLGVFKDPEVTSLHDQLLPWVVETMQCSLVKRVAVSEILETVFKQTVRELSRQQTEAVTVEYARREQIRQEEIRKKKDSESRKQKRNELRAKRQAERERLALKAKIEDEILAPGVYHDGITRQVLSDSDGRHTEPVMCSPGGQIGEFLLLLSSVEEVLEIELSQEQVTAYLHHYLMHGMNAGTMVYSNLNPTALERFNELIAEGLPQEYEEAQRMLIDFLLNPEHSVPRTSLTALWNNPESFGIRYGLAEYFLYAFFSILAAKEDHQHAAAKEKLAMKALNWPENGKEAAIVRIKIPMKREEREDEEHTHSEIPDDQLIDRILMVNPTHERFSVLVIHHIAQRFFRNEIMHWIKNSRLIEAMDYDRLKAVYISRALDFEEKIISMKADGQPEYEFEIN